MPIGKASACGRPNLHAAVAILAEQMPELALHLLGKPTHRSRDEWRFGRKGSLAVMVAGPKRGAWHDHEAGAHGDALGLVAHIRRTSMRTALQWALTWLGHPPASYAPLVHPRRVADPACGRVTSSPGTVDFARRIWRDAAPADCAGSLVPIYLAYRGVRLEPAAPIRFHPDCPRSAERCPAMLALMTDPVTGEPSGVHRTFLARDGVGKAPGPLPAKMMSGRAGVVRLVPDEDVATGLGLAEGIETALAVMQLRGWRPVWAAGSAGFIAGFPILSQIESLTVFADADAAGADDAQRCTARWKLAGRHAGTWTPAVGDFNDQTRAYAP